MRRILRSYQPLIIGLIILFSLLAFRMIWHGSFHFAFLIWNIFLAILPLCFAHLATRPLHIYARCCWAALWLLFFPNSAYLITDIVHLDMREGAAFWLDLVLLFGGGMYGVVLGLRSLQVMEGWYRRLLSPVKTVMITGCVLLISGYGIYLGRVERWNSWDLLFNTGDLLYAIAYEVRHPFRCLEVWCVSGVFAAALGLGYFALGRRQIRL